MLSIRLSVNARPSTIARAKFGRVRLSTACKDLRSLLQRHLEAHLRCYGTGNVKPKHHWMFDVAEGLERDAAEGVDAFVDMFAIERLHLRCKRRVAAITNTRRFGKNVRFLIYASCLCSFCLLSLRWLHAEPANCLCSLLLLTVTPVSMHRILEIAHV